jgi:hypothetical protein
VVGVEDSVEGKNFIRSLHEIAKKVWQNERASNAIGDGYCRHDVILLVVQAVDGSSIEQVRRRAGVLRRGAKREQGREGGATTLIKYMQRSSHHSKQ